MSTTPDGPRYVASLRDEQDITCYKDFFETETFHIAKEKADERAEKYNRSAIVYDRKLMEIVHKKDMGKPPELKKVESRGKKVKKTEEAKSNNDDYF